MVELLSLGVSQSSIFQWQPRLGLPTKLHCSIPRTRIAFKQPGHVRCFFSPPQVVSTTNSSSTIITNGIQESEPEIGGGGGSSSGRFNGGGGGGGGGNEGEEESSGDKKRQMGLSMSQKLTLGYAVLVGVGGLMGYLKSGSQKSLLAGGISSALLLLVFSQLPTKPVFASSIGLVISGALMGVMGSRFMKSHKIFPAGVVSFVSLVMTGGYLHGVMRSLH